VAVAEGAEEEVEVEVEEAAASLRRPLTTLPRRRRRMRPGERPEAQ